MNVLLTGGAGYIGSHAVRALQAAGHTPVALDNLSKGHRAAVGEATFVKGDVGDAALLRRVMREHAIDAVIHFAAFIQVAESCADPGRYYNNNTIIGLTLLDAMRECGVKRMVFSSTAAVYGVPEQVPIVETQRLAPINPYGASKLCVEYMLGGYAAAYDMAFVSLRYFNVAGAAPDGGIGEDHDPETHLIPLTLQVAQGRRERIMVFGDNYDTPDGTCVRDYIHVCDLVDAHVLALDAAEAGAARSYNLGNGEGFSVRQVVEACRKVTGHPIPAETAPRRPGDPDALIASSALARRELGWSPRYPHLETIVTHAWQWHLNHPDGYAK